MNLRENVRPGQRFSCKVRVTTTTEYTMEADSVEEAEERLQARQNAYNSCSNHGEKTVVEVVAITIH